MSGSFFAEVLKLRKRPAVWVLSALWLGVVVLFLYLFPALIFAAVAGDAPPEAPPEDQLAVLTPENLVLYLMRFLFPGLGTAVALVLGALAAGSEYGYGTLKLTLSQRPDRLGVLWGKLLALGALLLLFVLVAYVGGGLSSLVVALFAGASVAPPPILELLGGLGAATLMLALWGAAGFALATLFRGTRLAVGLGLVYVFTAERVLLVLSAPNESLQGVTRFLPGVNTSVLSAAFDGAENLGEVFLSPALSALVMLLYAVAFVLVAALIFLRSDAA